METLTITQPDDWHLHVRDGDALKAVIGATANTFARAIIMPNLTPPVTTVAMAETYRQRVLDALPTNNPFEPLMTLYLTDQLDCAEIERAKASPYVHAVKLYPAGATTNSESGVADLESIYPVLAAMEEHDLPLLIHGEVVDSDIDIFDREAVFIERHLRPIVARFPALRIVLEHITTREAVDFVTAAPANVAATLTVHHLMLNRNDLLVGGVRPHHYCLPVLKRETHRQALLAAAISGNPKFFLGTDSAPHAKTKKEAACGCAGIYSAPVAIEAYATVFEQAGALDKLEGFASFFGADFYGLSRNQRTITLSKQRQTVPSELPLGDGSIVPFCAGQMLAWRIDRVAT